MLAFCSFARACEAEELGAEEECTLLLARRGKFEERSTQQPTHNGRQPTNRLWCVHRIDRIDRRGAGRQSNQQAGRALLAAALRQSRVFARFVYCLPSWAPFRASSASSCFCSATHIARRHTCGAGASNRSLDDSWRRLLGGRDPQTLALRPTNTHLDRSADQLIDQMHRSVDRSIQLLLLSPTSSNRHSHACPHPSPHTHIHMPTYIQQAAMAEDAAAPVVDVDALAAAVTKQVRARFYVYACDRSKAGRVG